MEPGVLGAPDNSVAAARSDQVRENIQSNLITSSRLLYEMVLDLVGIIQVRGKPRKAQFLYQVLF